MVVKEFLDSDRVNFLIWRYLLEGNYRETAAKFQKEWHVKEPHRDFDFARYVKGHALVSVVNSGLVYYALEREHARRQMSDDVAANADALRVGVFGPLHAQPTKQLQDGEEAQDGEAEAEAEALRKRAQLSLPTASPPKRPRFGHAYDSRSDVATVADAMEVDNLDNQLPLQPQLNFHGQPQNDENQSQQDNQAYPSPLEGEQMPTPIVRTDGPEQGTQVDKVEELLPDTTFLHLADEPYPTESTASPPPADAENVPILLQCEWNPSDPSILAAAGTDSLARLWTISRATTTTGSGPNHVSPHAHALLDPDMPRPTTVTALAWTSDGNAIAVATDSGSEAAVSVWSVDGTLIHTLEVSEPPVIKLCWNTNNTAILAISPEKNGALITVYATPSDQVLTYRLNGYELSAAPPDAAWISDTKFLICGGDLFECLQCGEKSIERLKKFETREDDSFTQVLFDWRSGIAATSSDKGILDLWDEDGQRRSILAHQGAITTMAWQPLTGNQPADDEERLIATGGDDCAILIWNARRPESKAKCFLTMESPIVRLAFTPDGAFIAGAISSQVLIWKVGSHIPRASWSRPPDPGWLSPKGSDAEEEDEHCLCWDMTGQKLAYGSNNRLAVINFSR